MLELFSKRLKFIHPIRVYRRLRLRYTNVASNSPIKFWLRKKNEIMRDKSRIPKVLKLVEEVWTENPDFRLGQSIVSAVRPSVPTPEIFHIEDEIIEQKLEELLLTMRKTRQQKP
jgi:hypothetical protein